MNSRSVIDLQVLKDIERAASWNPGQARDLIKEEVLIWNASFPPLFKVIIHSFMVTYFYCCGSPASVSVKTEFHKILKVVDNIDVHGRVQLLKVHSILKCLLLMKMYLVKKCSIIIVLSSSQFTGCLISTFSVQTVYIAVLFF